MKAWLFPLAVVLFLSACSSSKNAQQPTANRKDIKGSWILNKISYEGLTEGQKYKIELLDEGYAECLEGSTWVLPNNAFGSYTIASTAKNCVPGEKKIVWSYREENDQSIFQYKRQVPDTKAKNVTDGYKLKVVSATDDAMQLQSQALVDGKTIYVNYQFSKIK